MCILFIKIRASEVRKVSKFAYLADISRLFEVFQYFGLYREANLSRVTSINHLIIKAQ